MFTSLFLATLHYCLPTLLQFKGDNHFFPLIKSTAKKKKYVSNMKNAPNCVLNKTKIKKHKHGTITEIVLL